MTISEPAGSTRGLFLSICNGMIKVVPILFIFVLLLSPSVKAQTFGAKEFKLENGMHVVVIPNHRAPVITHMIWVKVGGADNQPGRSGMAHYFEHLMFKGTPSVAAGDYSKIVKTLGGNDNAFTGQDYTAYFFSVSVDNLERIMKMESDRLQNLSPPEEHFKSEKAVVIEERKQRTENDPRAMFFEQMDSALYVNHPYATPVIGWMDEIEKYEWPDVKAYYDSWYTPQNMIVVVSGDITVDEFKPLAEKYYGVIPQKKMPPRLRPAVPPGNAKTILTQHSPAVHQPVFVRTYIAPAFARDKKDALALDVLSEIMDGGPTTRLYKNLVVEQKKATSVQFSYESTALDYGSITIAATPAAAVSIADLESAIDAQIKDVLEQGVQEIEVSDAVQRLTDEAIFARDSIAGPAMIFGAALATGSRVEDVENWTADIAQVKAADVLNVARKYLGQDKIWIRPPVTGYLLPEEKSAAAPVPKTTPEKEEATNVQR